LAIYLITVRGFRVKRVSFVKNNSRFIKFYDHEERKWFYEYLGTEAQKFNSKRLLHWNVTLATLLHLFGTGGFIHFFLYGEEEEDIETGIFYTAFCIVFQIISMFPVFNSVKYYRLSTAVSDTQILQSSPCFTIGSPLQLTMKQLSYQALSCNYARITLARYRTVFQNNIRGKERWFSCMNSDTRCAFSRTITLPCHQTVKAGEHVIISAEVSIPFGQPCSGIQQKEGKNFKDEWFLKVAMNTEELPTYTKEVRIILQPVTSQ